MKKKPIKSSEIAHFKREHSKTSYNIPVKRKRKRDQSLQNYHEKKAKLFSNGDAALQKFREVCKQYPIYPCAVCGRIMFRFQVKKFVKEKIQKSADF